MKVEMDLPYLWLSRYIQERHNQGQEEKLQMTRLQPSVYGRPAVEAKR